MRLKGKVALVTGSSRGIGRATALLFAKEGADIIVNFQKSEKEAGDLVKEIKSLGQQAIAVKCDVSDEGQVKKMIDQAIKTFKRIDVLVNNAAIVCDTPFKERTVAQWKRTLDVNLLGVFLVAKFASPHMPKGSTIVNVSSINGLNSPFPSSIDYDASKAGVIVVTKDLAKEFAPDIRVNAVAPGWVSTDMNKDLPKEFVKTEAARAALKRFAAPEEIAKAILFLASEDASYVNGTTLVVDGCYE